MEKGYSATSMRDLASAVGILPSSLYSHIKSKQELLQDICFECGSKFLEGIDDIIHEDAKPEVKVVRLIRLHVAIAREDATSMTVFNDEWRHLEEPKLSEFRQMRKSYEAKSLDILRNGVSMGIFRDVNEYVALNVILNSTIWVQKSKRLQSLDPGALTADIADLILNGLKKRIT
jgi:AcrR family transcriptional regulator